jgi:putative endonuclease
MFYVYIIYNQTLDIFYKGFTENLEKRIFEHQNGMSRFTSQNNNWVLVYSKKFETKKDALIEEKRIKKLNRKSLELLIKKG